jgi:TonB-linked SusC/RagA family outer membrane protein
MKNFKILTTLLVVLLPLQLWAQQVTGTVSEKETQLPVIGATVQVKGTTHGVVTDLDGHYTINAQKGDILLFSYIGKQTVEFKVDRQKTIDIILKDNTQSLDEIVVIGYGTQRKRDLTGNVVSVKTDELVKQPSLSATSAIQGKVAGVQIIDQGRPGSSPQVKIRGIGTLNGNTSPLYIVDGMVTGDIANINAADIASMEILKDASSAAIYGARAANGVIIISTKRAREGKFSINYNGYIGISSTYNTVKMANAQEYATYQNNAVAFDSPGAQLPFDNPKALGKGTDWIDQVTRAAISHHHTLAISGGTEQLKAYFSASYVNDESIIKGEDYRRITVRNNLEIKPVSWLTVKNNISFSDYKNNTVPGNIIKDAYKQEPTFDVLNDEGQYGSSNITNVANPVASLYYHHGGNKGSRLQELFSATATFMKGFKAKTELGIDMGWNRGFNYSPVYKVSAIQKNDKSTVSTNMFESRHITWNNSLHYNTLINDIHRLSADAILTTEYYKATGMSGSRNDVPEKTNLWYLDQGDVKTSIAGGWGDKRTRVSYIGRIGYTLMDRYIINATLRREGSSKFPSYNRFGTFYSLGGAWIISEEKFMQPYRDIIESLKLKASYGVIGNDGIPSNAFIYTVSTGRDYVFGNTQERQVGSIEDAIKDKYLKWETTSEFDLGLAFSLFKGRLNGEIAYYNKYTDGAFINVATVATLGGSNVLTNYIDIRNTGTEIALSWQDDLNKNISYRIGANASFNRNKVEKIADAISLKAGNFGSGYQITNTVPGQAIGQFYGYQVAGVFQSQTEIDNYTWTNAQGVSQKIMPNAAPGQLKYQDLNNDGKISAEDMTFIGSYQPDMYFGFNLGLNAYGFDFSADFYGALGAKIFNGLKGERFGGENITQEIAQNAWTPEKPSSSIPRPYLAADRPSSYYVESADYLRLNNVTLGYTLPQSLTKKLSINKLRIYTSVQNPFILTNYSGYNVEQPGGTLDSGIEMDPYPMVRKVMFGLSINL